MTDYITNDTDLTSVANAIRVKAELTGSLEFPSGFITAINSITGGGMTVTRTQDAAGGEVLTITGEATEIEPLSVSANGTYTAPSGKAYSPVTVSTPVATLTTKSITSNGTYNASSDSADGYSSVTVNVPQGITPTGTINITQNGTVDVTNYASANVNVSGGGGGETIAISFNGFQGNLYYVDTQSDTIQKVECTSQAYTYTVPLNSMVVLMWSVPRNPDFSPTNLSLAYSVSMGSRANYNYVDVYLAC